MDGSDYLEAIERESEQVLRAARRNQEAPVPSCPGWTVRDLVGHLGQVQSSVAAGVEARYLRPFPEPAAPSGDLLDWFEEGFHRLVAVLRDVGTEMPVWTLTGADGVPGRSRWWYRRQAHEAAVHRWDADAAVGRPVPIERALALDGIEEFFEVGLAYAVRKNPGTFRGRVELAPTDCERRWMLDLAVGRARPMSVTEVAEERTRLRGTASTLVLWLWNRPVRADLEVDGDPDLPEQWARLARF